MHQSIIVVDDFYDDGHEVRQRALELEFPDPPAGKTYYAGRNSRLMLMNDPLIAAFSNILGRAVVPSRESANGKFRISLADDKPRQDIHTDPGVDWGAILYLNPPEQCRGGTSFWRHKELGLDGMPDDDDEIRRLGYRDYDHMRRSIVEGDGVDRSKWEHLMTVPMRFNRLVLFRANQWHTFAENFGTTIEDGRLIQVFFFDYAGTRPGAVSPYDLAKRAAR